jgi:protein-L-isoaspartate(D-aspartate) O-methyltransferase
MDFAKARHAMVESQIRPNEVTDPALVAAFRKIPREAFVPQALRSVAYADQELRVGAHRFLLRPRDLAKLAHNLAPRPGGRALDIAGATGYSAALLADVGCAVTLLEPDAALTQAAAASLKSVGLEGVKLGSTALADGWRDGAPYDLILVNGAVEDVPQAWVDQLADGGRLGVIVRRGAAGAARIYTKSGALAAYRVAFDAAPPLLPGLGLPPKFNF